MAHVNIVIIYGVDSQDSKTLEEHKKGDISESMIVFKNIFGNDHI